VAPERGYVAAIDGGGTKTLVAAMRLSDGAIWTEQGDGSNYQGCGIAKATAIWRSLLDDVLGRFGATRAHVAAAGLGIAGFDRPKDEIVLAAAFDELLPGIPRELANDAYPVLRAGTSDGVGVAVISGTGCNAMGTGPAGKRYRIGGLGPDFGDLGSGTDIAIEALRRAFRSQDGRGPQTLLAHLIRQKLGLQRLDDLVDLSMHDSRPGTAYHPGLLAPLVFEAAGLGDPQAISVLEWAGSELGLSARAVARQLFSWDAAFPLVMGGSVLQRSRTSHLRDALVADVRREFPRVTPVLLDLHPVAGGISYALDLAAGLGVDVAELRKKVREHFHLQGPLPRPSSEASK